MDGDGICDDTDGDRAGDTPPHDTDGGPAPEEAMAENFVEYGRRLEKLIAEVRD